MKNLFEKLFLLSTVFALVFLFSCGDDDTEDPTPENPTVIVDVKVNGESKASPATVAVGDEITADIDVLAAGGFNVFRVYVVQDGTTKTTLELVRTSLPDIADLTDFETSLEIMASVPDTLAGTSITLEFEVVDDAGLTGSAADFVLDVEVAEAKVQTAVFLYAPTDNEESQTFYSIALDSIYSINEVEELEGASGTIDIGYFYVTEANLAAPSAYSSAFEGAYDISDWDTRRSTNMVLTDLTDVTEISTVSDVEEVLVGVDFGSEGQTTIEGLEVNQIYAFETEDGLQGLMRVVSIEPGFESNDYIELEFILASAE